jgi:hypothetical protein
MTPVVIEAARERLRHKSEPPAPAQIVIVKQSAATLVLRRRTELLRNVDYMETQIGRLAKMARDMRAEILLLTTE